MGVDQVGDEPILAKRCRGAVGGLAQKHGVFKRLHIIVGRRSTGTCRLNLNCFNALYDKARFGRDEHDLVVRLRRKSERQIQKLTRKMLMNEQQPQDSNPGDRWSRSGVCPLTVNGEFSLVQNNKNMCLN